MVKKRKRTEKAAVDIKTEEIAVKAETSEKMPKNENKKKQKLDIIPKFIQEPDNTEEQPESAEEQPIEEGDQLDPTEVAKILRKTNKKISSLEVELIEVKNKLSEAREKLTEEQRQQLDQKDEERAEKQRERDLVFKEKLAKKKPNPVKPGMGPLIQGRDLFAKDYQEFEHMSHDVNYICHDNVMMYINPKSHHGSKAFEKWVKDHLALGKKFYVVDHPELRHDTLDSNIVVIPIDEDDGERVKKAIDDIQDQLDAELAQFMMKDDPTEKKQKSHRSLGWYLNSVLALQDYEAHENASGSWSYLIRPLFYSWFLASDDNPILTAAYEHLGVEDEPKLGVTAANETGFLVVC